MKKNLTFGLVFALAAFVGVNQANAQVATPNLLINLVSDNVVSNIAPGAQNAILANIRLDATTSSDDIRLTTIPMILSTGSGARASDLTCRISNSASPSFALNTGNNVQSSMSNGLNTVVLDNPLIIARGTSTNLLVRCDVSNSLVSGGTYQFSINTNNVVATSLATGLPAVVGVMRTPGAIIPPTVPGIPNTGFGGNATTNIALILGSIVVAGLGLAYTRKLSR